MLSIISNSTLFIDEDGSSISNPIFCSPEDGLKNKNIEDDSLKRNLMHDFASTSKKKKKMDIVIKQEKE